MTTLKELFSMANFRVQFAVSFMLGIIVCVLTFWTFDTERPFEYEVAKSRVDTVREGNGIDATVAWKVAVLRTCKTGTIERKLFDPDTNIIFATYTKTLTGSQQLSPDGYLRWTFALPKQLPNERIGYKAEVCYSCNPLQVVWPFCYYTPELFFRVSL